MNKKFYFISIILILVSCAKKIIPNEGYNKINNKRAINLLELDKSNAKLLTPNIDYENELTLNDSIIKYNDSLKSNYQKFIFEVRTDKKNKIKVSSLCNCSGLKKYLFIPQIIIENSNDKNIAESDSTYFNYEKGPLTLNRVWNIDNDILKENKKIELLLFSDNSKLSENIYKFIVNPVGFVPINVKSTLNGKYIIKIEEY